MAVIKISEMTDATILQDEDYLPILQNNLNKKTKIELLRDYNKLHNKPILNGITIENSKTIFDYNIVKENQGIQINEDKKTLELETLGSIEIENRADVNKAVTIKTVDKTAKETAHQDMSKTYDPNGQTHLTEGENQPVSYKAVKKYVDTLESKVDANEQDIEDKYAALESKVDENEIDIENKYSALEEKVDTNESDIESKHTALNNKVDENERDIEDKVQKLDEKTAAKDSELENLITTNEQDIEEKYIALNQKVEQNKQTTDSEIQQLNSKDSELENLISANEEDIESKVQELDNKKLNREETPNTLPNPYALTFTGAVSGTYDGSAAKTINIPSVSGGGGSSYELPIATPTQLGGVKPVAKTDEMTQEVGVDEAGGLFTKEGDGIDEETLNQINRNTEDISKLSDSIANVGNPTDEQVSSAVNNYIEENGIDVGGMEWGRISNGEVFELSTEEEPAKPVPCTGITLDKTSLTISDIESTEILTVTVEPFETTDQVIWSIDNEEVATLVNGVVTPIKDGNAVVTVTCGSYSATCEITVKIIASYTKTNLKAYYDLTQYEDGYVGEVEDLSGNGVVPILTGQESYTTGRNGFIGGKFMINEHKTSASTLTIPNVAMATPPFSIEMYAHLRENYNYYATDGYIEFSGAMGTVVGGGNQQIVGTNITNQGVRMLASYDAKTLNVIGGLNEPNFGGTVENLQIDNRTDNEITDVYHHIVYCIGATEQKIYCDGILVATNKSNDYTTKFTTTNDYKLFEGSEIKADLKMVRIYNSILTDEQVANNYSHTIGTYGGEA